MLNTFCMCAKYMSAYMFNIFYIYVKRMWNIFHMCLTYMQNMLNIDVDIYFAHIRKYSTYMQSIFYLYARYTLTYIFNIFHIYAKA